ncbi:allophanate hydrolase-related protein [Haloechinothrix aidingensis]|nr:gamma-glutamylcyclotransferase [Haloechinothrix aidingensis]
MFLNGGGMRGGPLHPYLRGAPLVRTARTAAKYRFYSVDDRFPALEPTDSAGTSVAGEVYELPLDTLRDSLLPAEPAEVELGVIELEDGAPALAVLLRKEYRQEARLIDISHLGSWREYQDSREHEDG